VSAWRKRGRDVGGVGGHTAGHNCLAVDELFLYLCIQLLPLILPVAIHTLAVQPEQYCCTRTCIHKAEDTIIVKSYIQQVASLASATASYFAPTFAPGFAWLSSLMLGTGPAALN